MTGISFIVVNYYTSQLVNKLILSIQQNNNNNDFEIIVVDNTIAEKSRYYSKDSNVRVVYTDRNLGFGKACNIGAKLALNENLVFINPDCLFFQRDSLQKLSESFDRFSIETIFTGKILGRNKQPICNTFKFSNFANIYFQNTLGRIIGDLIPLLSNKMKNYLNTYDSKVDWISGAFLCVKKQFFLKLDGFDEDFFMYEEDAELCYRAKQSNGKVIFTPEINIIHLGGEASRNNNEILSYIGLASSLYFYEKRNSIGKTILLKKSILFTWNFIYINFILLAPIIPALFLKRKIFWKKLAAISRKYKNTPIKDLVYQ